MTKITVNGIDYEDYTDKIKRFYLKDDLTFTPKEGDSAGQEIKYKRFAIDIQIGSNEKTIILAPQDKSAYELISVAEDVEE